MKDYIQCFKSISKFYNIKFAYKIDLNNKITSRASCDIFKDSIFIIINPKDSLDFVFSVFFHEIAHIRNKYCKKFEIYHCFDFNSLSLKNKKKFVSQAWRAERYTDYIGKKLMKIHFPDLRYSGVYLKKFKKQDQENLKEEFKY